MCPGPTAGRQAAARGELIGIEGKRLAKAGDRLVTLPKRQQTVAERCPGDRIVRRERHGLSMCRDRREDVALAIQHRGECQGGLGIVGPQFGGAAGAGERGLVLVELRQQQPQAGQGGGMIRPQQIGGVKLPRSLERSAAAGERDAAREMDLRAAGLIPRASVCRRDFVVC